jgi:TfoX/Sxy family transcriptional regulator of competence genes
MSYNEQLAARVRAGLMTPSLVEEVKMMGGLTFMVDGKMCVGIIKDELMVRLNPILHDEALRKNGCRAMDMMTKPMRGYVLVNSTGLPDDEALAYWLELALDYNKIAKPSKKKK